MNGFPKTNTGERWAKVVAEQEPLLVDLLDAMSVNQLIALAGRIHHGRAPDPVSSLQSTLAVSMINRELARRESIFEANAARANAQ